MGGKTNETVGQFAQDRSDLFNILRNVREQDQDLTPEAVGEISRLLHISQNDIYSAYSFVGGSPTTESTSGGTVEATAGGAGNTSRQPAREAQVRTALRNCGRIDPESIEDYVAATGYSGLAKALKMTPREVIEEVDKSDLRGRGGAGFPVGKKWRACRDAPGEEKYFICNAHDGDPEACSGRVILENDPHSVLEGMLIGAYAVGASQGYVYVRWDAAPAISRLKTALKQMAEHGFTGDNILGTDFSFRIEIKEGPSDFVCGEETAIIRALEGKRPVPYSRPPFPATSGLHGKPTAINNVETLTNVSAIFQKGPVAYGTGLSKGTKVFTLTGKVAEPGVIEVPMGTSLRQVVFDIGGGIADGKSFKAALVGGPTGGFLPAGLLDTPLDFESLAAVGAIIGSGSIVVLDSDTGVVELTEQCVSFAQSESCGHCVLCREGTWQILQILRDVIRGKGKREDLELLQELGEGAKEGSLCCLGKTAPNPVLTSLEHFREDYEEHLGEEWKGSSFT
jgi:NADH-quinone oxidoreductase subunit F